MDQLYSPPVADGLLVAPKPHDIPRTVADPARVSPLHLPALAHVAADLDGLNQPVRIVAPAELGVCPACEHETNGPLLDAIATVVAFDTDGFRYRDPTCPLHLHSEAGYHTRMGRRVVVEVPASGGTRWFERSLHETYYGIDETHGIAVVRGMWDCWAVVEAADGLGADRALWTGPDRAMAEMLAQAVASTLAADAYELAQTAAWPLPVASVVAEVAAA